MSGACEFCDLYCKGVATTSKYIQRCAYLPQNESGSNYAIGLCEGETIQQKQKP